jgi:hypothetical protein
MWVDFKKNKLTVTDFWEYTQTSPRCSTRFDDPKFFLGVRLFNALVTRQRVSPSRRVFMRDLRGQHP